jgi:hypothetical protein
VRREQNGLWKFQLKYNIDKISPQPMPDLKFAKMSKRKSKI